MPTYIYEHPETEETIEVVQKMSDLHLYIDCDGLEWRRVFQSPNAAIDSLNDGSREGFMKHTQNKKGTMGDLWEASREAGEKREKQRGRDGVKEKFEKGYSKKRKGMKRKDSGTDEVTL
jgi:predicted nucleic acid-binding Zn ribbon protein